MIKGELRKEEELDDRREKVNEDNERESDVGHF